MSYWFVIGLNILACGQETTENVEAPPAETPQSTEVAQEEGKPAAADGDIPAPSDVASPPSDAQKTESGLAFKILSSAEGIHPTADDSVEVHYTGWTTDGKMFDSSVKRGKTASFPLSGVIAGWTEGLQLIGIGETARFWIPEDLAYKGQHGRPAGMLVFDVELISIQSPPVAPTNVAAAPSDSTVTESGLAYKVLKAGTGDVNPTSESVVRVHYSGWTTDGEMFDSSVMRGRPATFPLSGVIAGWTEGVQLMKVGGQTRFWIPEEIAYKGRPGAPQGMLVFDIELLEIVK